MNNLLLIIVSYLHLLTNWKKYVLNHCLHPLRSNIYYFYRLITEKRSYQVFLMANFVLFI